MIESANLLNFVHIVLPLLLLCTALVIVMTRNLLAAAILLGIFSLLMASLYLTFDAPDVAITEAAVGAGVGTVLLLCALIFVGTEDKGASYNLLLPLVVIIVTGSALLYATVDMPSFGDPNSPAYSSELTQHYITQSAKEIGIPNVVTSVLASYRGFDTLGETAVVFMAAIGVLLLLGGNLKEDEDEQNVNEQKEDKS